MTFLGYKPSTLALWVVLSLPALTMIGPLLGDDAQPGLLDDRIDSAGQIAGGCVRLDD